MESVQTQPVCFFKSFDKLSYTERLHVMLLTVDYTLTLFGFTLIVYKLYFHFLVKQNFNSLGVLDDRMTCMERAHLVCLFSYLAENYSPVVFSPVLLGRRVG